MNRHDRRDDWTLIIAVALIAFGGFMLVKTLGGSWWPLAQAFEWAERLVWPLVLIIIGVLLYISGKRRPLGSGPMSERRLYRSRSDRMVAGVLGGLGDYLGIDPVWLRVAFAVILLMGFGPAIILYIIGAVVIPEAPVNAPIPADWKATGSSSGGPAASSAPTPPPSSGWPHTGSEPGAPEGTPPPPPPPSGPEA